MTWTFLEVSVVEALHFEQIVRYGGSHGLRDPGLLESAVLRAKNKAMYDESATLPAVAASPGWGLIKNHAFIDGNKRIGFVSMIALLGLNGYEIDASEAEQLATVLKVAASEMSESEWTRWVETVSHPVEL